MKGAGKAKPLVPSAPDFAPSGFFAFRTPLLPFDELLGLAAGVEAPAALTSPDESRLEAALAADAARVRARLREAALRPEVREALFVASPVLDDSFEVWLREPDSERGRKVERSIMRYFSRMAGRPTPFGLFAGCSVGRLGDPNQLELAPRAAYQRHTRLDMDYVCALVDALTADPTLRSELTYVPNSSMYRAAGRMRYAESRMVNKSRFYHLAAVEATDYREAARARAQGGARPGELARALVAADAEVTQEEADGYIAELIDNQLLVPTLAPPATGPEPLPILCREMQTHP